MGCISLREAVWFAEAEPETYLSDPGDLQVTGWSPEPDIVGGSRFPRLPTVIAG
jgi:hypothetical protein